MTVTARLADGRELQFPDGTAPEVVQASVKKVLTSRIQDLKTEGVQQVAPLPFTPSGERDDPKHVLDFAGRPDMIAGNPVTRFALGAASPMIGLLQLGANAVGQGEGINAHLKQLEELKKSGREKIGSDGFDWTEGAGMVTSPAWRVLPNKATTLAGRVGEGAVTGGAAGATTPVTNGGENFWSDKAEQTSAGGAIGAVIPPAASVVKKVGSMGYHGLIEPAFEAGQRAIKGRAYLEAAGDKVHDIIDLLTKNKQLVAGSKPTAGEAATDAGRAEFSAMQQSAARVKPSSYLARGDEQNAARVAAIDEFAGTPAKIAEASAQRAARAGPHYDAAMTQEAPTSGLNTLMERPSSRAVLNRAERLMQEQDKEFKPLFTNGLPRNMNGQEAQTLKLAFDDMIKNFPKSAMDTAELDAIKATRAEFVSWAEKAFPELGRGRKLYKMESQPINQMEVGRALEDKLTPALRDDGKLRSTAFANATRDSAATVKKATGEPRFGEIEDVLTTRQLKAVHDVQADLARSDRHLDMSRKGAQAGPDALGLATGNLEREAGGKMPNLLNRHAMLLNAVIGRLEGKVNKKLAVEIAEEMLNPPTVAEALQGAQAREARARILAAQMRRLQRPAIAVSAAGVAQQQGDQ